MKKRDKELMGLALYRLRIRRGISQEEAAARCQPEVDKSTWCNWENRLMISENALPKAMQALEFSEEAFWYELWLILIERHGFQVPLEGREGMRDETSAEAARLQEGFRLSLGRVGDQLQTLDRLLEMLGSVRSALEREQVEMLAACSDEPST